MRPDPIARLEMESGFMDTPLPVVKLDDYSVTFWIPWWEWENVFHVLREAMERYPDYVIKAREGNEND